MEQNPSITASEIALALNITSRAVQKRIANLKTAGIIERIGSDKSGYWMTKNSGKSS
jgi:ATP-dependent DNA helicase RecG